MDTHSIILRLNKTAPRYFSIQRPNRMKWLVPIDVSLLSPKKRLAAFKLPTGTSMALSGRTIEAKSRLRSLAET